MTNGEYFVLTHPNVEVKENGTCVWIYNLDNTACNHYIMSMEWWNEEMVDVRPTEKIRWTDKLSIISNGDIIDFDGKVVGHINLADYGR